MDGKGERRLDGAGLHVVCISKQVLRKTNKSLNVQGEFFKLSSFVFMYNTFGLTLYHRASKTNIQNSQLMLGKKLAANE